MKTIVYEWESYQVIDRDIGSVLTELEARGYEIISLIPREKSEAIGLPYVTVIARKVIEYVEEHEKKAASLN